MVWQTLSLQTLPNRATIAFSLALKTSVRIRHFCPLNYISMRSWKLLISAHIPVSKKPLPDHNMWLWIIFSLRPENPHPIPPSLLSVLLNVSVLNMWRWFYTSLFRDYISKSSFVIKNAVVKELLRTCTIDITSQQWLLARFDIVHSIPFFTKQKKEISLAFASISFIVISCVLLPSI